MIAQSKGWYLSVLTAAAVTAAAVRTSHSAFVVSPAASVRTRGPLQNQQQPFLRTPPILSSSAADSNSPTEEERNDWKEASRVVYEFDASIDRFQTPSNLTTSSRPSSSSSASSNTNANTNNNNNDDMVVSKVLEKKIRVAKAQAEIDRILAQPEGAPFDLEAEMKKVISIAPRTTSASSPDTLSAAASLEQDMLRRHEETAAHDIERELYDAVRRQDYTTAAKKRALLNQIHMDDALAALQCNSAFYKAFSKKDAAAMQGLWLQDDSVVCIHPSHAPIVSAKNVNTAWQQMFNSGGGSFQRMWIEPRHIRVAVSSGGHGATITCDEHVFVRRFVRGQKRQTECINRLTATNIYRKVGAQWYIVHHHASWHAESDAAQQVLARSTGSSSSASSAAYLQSLKRRQEATTPPQQGNFGLEGILGMKDFGPLLGSSSKKKLSSSSDAVPPRRIVMGTGSLSDILNGNLQDLLRDKSNDSSKGGDSDESGAAIIQFHRIESDGADDDDDDDEEEEELDEEDDDVEEVEIELTNGDHGSKEAFSIIKEWAETRGKPSKTNPTAVSTDATKSVSIPEEEKEDQKSNCLSMIRQLCQQGMVSSKHKRVLLSDMISCAAKKEQSIIQVAYEFLFSDTDNDAAEEEFADQCRRIAESLPDL